MHLPSQRVGPYVRALQAGLHALAPNDDFVPLARALAHLRALDPALSGELLAPAEVDDRSGMPAYPWLERATAEQQVLDEQGAADAADAAERVADLDPALAARMRHRARLHAHLARHPLLRTSRFDVALRFREPDEVYRATYDRVAPSGIWIRIRAELLGAPGWAEGVFVAGPDGHTVPDAGVRHLFARHAATPLAALARQLAAGTGARVRRLARSALGPFWFPGIPLPADVPPVLGKGLLLHQSTEVIGDDVHHSHHRDPWMPAADGERVPPGYGLYRERRFAASPGLGGVLRDWAAGRCGAVDVVGLRGG